MPGLSEAEARLRSSSKAVPRGNTPSDLPGEEGLTLGCSAMDWTVRLDRTHDTGSMLAVSRGAPSHWQSSREWAARPGGGGRYQERPAGPGERGSHRPVPLTAEHAWEGCVRWCLRGRRPGVGGVSGTVALVLRSSPEVLSEGQTVMTAWGWGEGRGTCGHLLRVAACGCDHTGGGTRRGEELWAGRGWS